MPEVTPFYVTTSIAYPNANPHIGYAMELAQADFLARYARLNGQETTFLTGLDVHGLKLQKAAEKAGQAPEAFVAEKAEVFRALAAKLGLSHDRFILTNDPDHEAMAQAIWRMCAARGDIYKKRYQAWYNVKEEEFLGLVEEHPDPSAFGIDPAFIEKIDEENYFFRLSRYKDEVLSLLKGGELSVVPSTRATELVNFVEEKGLEDVSISRERTRLAWGVPVPDDEEQVMYVWFDALTNYLTPVAEVDGRGMIAVGPKWPADVHCIGKDISRFHALLWPGMLLSAGLPVPKQILVHGFITSGGVKMSKSLGNVIDPFPVLGTYGTDAVRWYLLKEVSTTNDGDYNEERQREVYAADLANDYGNLVSRIWTMCQKYAEGKVPQVVEGQTDNAERAVIEEAWGQYHEAVAARNIQQALQVAHGLVVFCNKRIEEHKPWAMAKDPFKAEELNEFLYELVESIRHITLMLSPAMPETAKKVAERVLPRVGDSFADAAWGGLRSGELLGSEQTILFPRLEA